jgi:GAF domain-containing protein
VTDEPLTASLAALSRYFVGDGTLEETLHRVCDLTVDAVPPAEFVGITLMVEGRARTAVFTDEKAPEIDQAQYDSGDGPCLEAFRSRTITEVPSTVEPGPWEPFRRAAADHGILSTLSFPLVVDKTATGAMNLYARTERAFDDDHRRAGELFATQAAVVLANAQAYWDARNLGARLGEAMKSRSIIEQAKGILMAAERCDEDTAFARLVERSQRENVKLRDVAARMVDEAVHGGEPDPA